MNITRTNARTMVLAVVEAEKAPAVAAEAAVAEAGGGRRVREGRWEGDGTRNGRR